MWENEVIGAIGLLHGFITKTDGEIFLHIFSSPRFYCRFLRRGSNRRRLPRWLTWGFPAWVLVKKCRDARKKLVSAWRISRWVARFCRCTRQVAAAWALRATGVDKPSDATFYALTLHQHADELLRRLPKPASLASICDLVTMFFKCNSTPFRWCFSWEWLRPCVRECLTFCWFNFAIFFHHFVVFSPSSLLAVVLFSTPSCRLFFDCAFYFRANLFQCISRPVTAQKVQQVFCGLHHRGACPGN